MTRKNVTNFICLTILWCASTVAYAELNSTTTNITLKQTCLTSDDTCFDKNEISAMLDWIWGTRRPGSVNPLVVDIEPGVYSMPNNKALCNDDGSGFGYVSFRGADRSNTILTGGLKSAVKTLSNQAFQTAVISIYNCQFLSFQDMTIKTGQIFSGSGTEIAVDWIGGGSSVWTNVSIESAVTGWYGKSNGVKHSFYSSSIRVTPIPSLNSHYVSAAILEGGEYSFFGSELSIINHDAALDYINVLSATARSPTVNIVGSSLNLYTNVAVNTQSWSGIYAITATFDAKVYMTNGFISVIADTSENQNAIALSVGSNLPFGNIPLIGGYISTSGVYFDLQAGGSGLLLRELNFNTDGSGVIKVPYQSAYGY